MGILKGYKTYIVAGVAVIGAIAGYLVGDLTLAAALQTGITGLMGITLRSAIATK